MILRLLRQRKLLIGAAFLLIVVAIFIYFQNTKNSVKTLQSAKVKRGNIEKNLTLSGNINVY